jgi:prepilin-type N-terminal cleavage/methylation domain-containing protein
MLEQLRKKRDQEGFTLIELLIVIVILGILATIVVFAVAGIRDKGNKSACKAEYKTLETAAEAYYAQNGSYTNGAGLVTAQLLKTAPSKGYDINTTSGAVTVPTSGDCNGITPGS